MEDQTREGIVERITEIEKIVGVQKSENSFCLRHRPVIRTSAKSTTLRIVYDVSTKSS